MKEFKIAILILFGCTTVTNAQQAPVATGGDAYGNSGSVNYTIGQIAYISINNTTGKVNEGVQQPFELFTIAGIEHFEINIGLSAFPNPTTEWLILSVPLNELDGVSYQLTDKQGKLIESKNVFETETPVNMKDLAPAIYFLKVQVGTKGFTLFKIVKK